MQISRFCTSERNTTGSLDAWSDTQTLSLVCSSQGHGCFIHTSDTGSPSPPTAPCPSAVPTACVCVRCVRMYVLLVTPSASFLQTPALLWQRPVRCMNPCLCVYVVQQRNANHTAGRYHLAPAGMAAIHKPQTPGLGGCGGGGSGRCGGLQAVEDGVAPPRRSRAATVVPPHRLEGRGVRASLAGLFVKERYKRRARFFYK